MRIPESPKPIDELMEKLLKQADREKIARILGAEIGVTDAKGRYLHWGKLKHLSPPKGLSSDEHWLATKLARQKISKNLPFKDKKSQPFSFCLPDSVQQELHWLDQNATGTVTINNPIGNPHTRQSYLLSSLIEESISSSQLEGASTTRAVAKEMLRQGRQPKDHSEQMIFNNHQAMAVIKEFGEDDLTPSLILHLHEVLTKGTLADPNKAGQLRSLSDEIHIVAADESVLHTPPLASELEERLKTICDFANDDNAKVFIHPVVKAIVLHFMIGYEHPFVDGNGRTARALFYWLMAKQGYGLLEFVSISRMIKTAPLQYGKAYLQVETDGNDVTYFLIHQLEVIRKGITALQDYLDKKATAIESVEKHLENSKAKGQLNHRQLSLLKHAVEHPNSLYTIKEHQASHGISYQTARTDLLKLSDELDLLRKRKYGKSLVFVSPSDLGGIL